MTTNNETAFSRTVKNLLAMKPKPHSEESSVSMGDHSESEPKSVSKARNKR